MTFKHFIIQLMYQNIIRRYNTFKIFFIILIVSTNYILVNHFDNKVFGSINRVY